MFLAFNKPFVKNSSLTYVHGIFPTVCGQEIVSFLVVIQNDAQMFQILSKLGRDTTKRGYPLTKNNKLDPIALQTGVFL